MITWAQFSAFTDCKEKKLIFDEKNSFPSFESFSLFSSNNFLGFSFFFLPLHTLWNFSIKFFSPSNQRVRIRFEVFLSFFFFIAEVLVKLIIKIKLIIRHASRKDFTWNETLFAYLDVFLFRLGKWKNKCDRRIRWVGFSFSFLLCSPTRKFIYSLPSSPPSLFSTPSLFSLPPPFSEYGLWIE